MTRALTQHLPLQLLRFDPTVVENANLMIAMKPACVSLPILDGREQQKRATVERMLEILSDEGTKRDDRISELEDAQNRTSAALRDLDERVQGIDTNVDDIKRATHTLKVHQDREVVNRKRDIEMLSNRLSELERQFKKQASAPPMDDSFITAEVCYQSRVVSLIRFECTGFIC